MTGYPAVREKSVPSAARGRTERTWTWRRIGAAAVRYSALFGLAVFLCAPFAWMLLTAFKSPDEVFTIPPTWWPRDFSTENFSAAAHGDFARSLLSSLLVCVGTTALCMVLALLACYSLTRPRFRGRSGVLGAVLVSQLLPHAVLLVPIYRAAREVGMLNTRWGLVVALLAFLMPVGIWLLRGFLSAVPIEVEEAARLDGLSPFAAYWRVTVPMSTPGVLAVAVYVFFTSWQDFIFAMVFLTDPSLATTPLALLGFIGQNSVDWGLLMAASTIMMVPVLLLFALVQRSFVGGLTGVAVKG